jgi:flavin reductase (DIM6/NTAB) family NADH-FMN oxidoreductase RutF
MQRNLMEPTVRDEFREAMSQLASGVVLVTASIDGRPWGMTVSAACPVCLEPPTMLVSLSAHTALARAIADCGRFGVSILGARALDVARFGSAVGAPKFLDDGVGLSPGEIVDGAISHIDCEVAEQVEHGTHRLFLGRVRTTTLRAAAGPLVHYRRGYWQIGEAA